MTCSEYEASCCGESLETIIDDTEPSLEEIVQQRELAQYVDRLLGDNRLSQSAVDILRLIYGLDGEVPLTHAEVAQFLKVSPFLLLCSSLNSKSASNSILANILSLEKI